MENRYVKPILDGSLYDDQKLYQIIYLNIYYNFISIKNFEKRLIKYFFNFNDFYKFMKIVCKI